MNWFDAVIILLILCFGYVGFLRGFLGVLLDLTVILFCSGFASMVSSNLAPALAPKGGVLYDTVSIVAWVVVFIATASAVLHFGQKLNESAEKGTPLFLWKGLGGFLGILEGIFVLFFIFHLMGQTELHRAVTATFKNSGMVSSIQGLSPAMENYYIGVCNARSKARIKNNFKVSIFRNKKI